MEKIVLDYKSVGSVISLGLMENHVLKLLKNEYDLKKIIDLCKNYSCAITYLHFIKNHAFLSYFVVLYFYCFLVYKILEIKITFIMLRC